MVARVAPLLFLGLGVFLLTQVALPFLAFKVWEISALKEAGPLVAPVAGVQRGDLVSGNVLGVSVAVEDDFPRLISSLQRANQVGYQTFRLWVPKLKIARGVVRVDSNDLDETLAHLPGTALPGEKGNVFISGHSSAGIKFKGDSFYKKIFGQLNQLKLGDEILLEALGQEFKYTVWQMRAVDPKDLSVIFPPDVQGRYVTLMTCVPPGFNTKRLVVIGKLK